MLTLLCVYLVGVAAVALVLAAAHLDYSAQRIAALSVMWPLPGVAFVTAVAAAIVFAAWSLVTLALAVVFVCAAWPPARVLGLCAAERAADADDCCV